MHGKSALPSTCLKLPAAGHRREGPGRRKSLSLFLRQQASRSTDRGCIALSFDQKAYVSRIARVPLDMKIKIHQASHWHLLRGPLHRGQFLSTHVTLKRAAANGVRRSITWHAQQLKTMTLLRHSQQSSCS
eukprot:1145437-Pelagomonas_calceolata.AAC.6